MGDVIQMQNATTLKGVEEILRLAGNDARPREGVLLSIIELQANTLLELTKVLPQHEVLDLTKTIAAYTKSVITIFKAHPL